jgi:hypothetical protein
MDINSIGGPGFPEEFPPTSNNGSTPLSPEELDPKVSSFKEVIAGELKKVKRSLSRLSAQLSQEIRQNPSSTSTLVASYREQVKSQIENFSKNLPPEAEAQLQELAPSHENEVMTSIQNELLQKYSAPSTAVNTLLANSNSSSLTQLCHQFLATSDVNLQEQIFEQIQMALGGLAPSQAPGSSTSESDNDLTTTPLSNAATGATAAQTPEPPPPPFQGTLPAGEWVVPFRIDPPPGTSLNQVYISDNQPFYNSKGDLVSTGTTPVLLSSLDCDATGPYLYLPSGNSGNIVIAATPINADPPPAVGTANAPYGMWEYTNKTDANGVRHINVDYSNVDNLTSSGAITFWNKDAQGQVTPTTTGSTGSWFPMVQKFSQYMEQYGQAAGWTQAMINSVVNGIGSDINGISPKHFAEEFFAPNFNCFFKDYLQNTLFKPGANGTLIGQGIQFTTRDGLFTLNGLTTDGQSLHFVNETTPSETIDIPLNLNSGLGWFSGGCCDDWQQFASNGTAQDLIRDITGIVNLGMTAQSIKTYSSQGIYDPTKLGEWIAQNPQKTDQVFYQTGVPYNVYERSVHEAGFNSYAFDYDECSGQSSDQDNLPSNVDHVTISWGSWSDQKPDPSQYPQWAKSLMSALNPTPPFTGEKKKLADGLLSWINREAIENPSPAPSIADYFTGTYPTNPTDSSQDIYMQYPGITQDDVVDICQLIGVINPPLPTRLDSLVSQIGIAVNTASMGGDALDFAHSIESEIYSLNPTNPASITSFNQWIQTQCTNLYSKYPDLIKSSTQILWVTQIALACNVVLPAYNQGSLPSWAQPYQTSLNQLNVTSPAGISYRNFLLSSLYSSQDLKSYQSTLGQFCSSPANYLQDLFFHFPGINQSDLNLINSFYKSASVPTITPTDWDTRLSYLINPTQAPPSLPNITTAQGIATQEALITFILGQSNPSSSYDLTFAYFSKLAQQYGLLPSNPDYKTICSALGITPPPPSPLAAYIADINSWMQDQNPGIQELGNDILQYINKNPSLTPQQLISYLNTKLSGTVNSLDIYLQYQGLTNTALQKLCTAINQTYGSAGVAFPSATSMDQIFLQAWNWQPQASGVALKQDLLSEILSLGSQGTQVALTTWAKGIQSGSADYKNASLIDQATFCQITNLQPPTSLMAYIIDINTWMQDQNPGIQGLGNAILQYINSNPSLTPQQLISYLNTKLSSSVNSQDIYLQYQGLTNTALQKLCTVINQTYGSAGVAFPSATSMDQIFLQTWNWQPRASGVALKQDLLSEILSLGSQGTQVALTTWAKGIQSGSADYKNASLVDQATFCQITKLPTPSPSGPVPTAIINEINTYYGNFTNLYRVLQAMNIPGFTNIFGQIPLLNLPNPAAWNLLMGNMRIRCSQNPNPSWIAALQFAQTYSSSTQYDAGGALFSALTGAANQPGETSKALLETLVQLQKQSSALSIPDETEVNKLIDELSQSK